MDRRIKFRHLDAFSAIARARSLKRAAEQLNLSQPAISKTLKDLEAIVGTVLMERSRSGVHLTTQGEVFLQFAEQSTAALRHGLRSVQAQGGAVGHLRVGALPSVASHLLPTAVLEFCRVSPETLLELHEGPHHDLTARLRSGALDLVVGRLGNPDTMTGLGFRQLYAEEVVVVTRPDSPAARVTSFANLGGFRVLYPPKDSAIRPLVARLLIAQGVALFEKRIETASSAFGRAMVLADSDIVWVISLGVVAADLRQGHLVRLAINTAATLGAIGVMTRAAEAPSAAARSFSQVLGRSTGEPGQGQR